MRNETRVTMVSPEPGFSGRVMARIAARDRLQARRRALIRIALLVTAVAVALAVSYLWLAAWIEIIVSPETIAPLVLAFSSLFGGWIGLLQAIWVAITVIASELGELPILSYAFVVLAMTIVWARIVTGPLQHPSPIQLGGSK